MIPTSPGAVFDLNPTEVISAPDCPSREPDRHYFAKKRHYCFEIQPKSPRIGVNMDKMCPEKTLFSTIPMDDLPQIRTIRFS